MPVKHPAGDGDDLPLTPAMRFALLTGRSPDVRIHGWVALAQQGQFGEPTTDQVWAAHREALVAEAKAHAFVPYWHTKRAPTGRGFEEWRDRFLATHRY